MRKTLLCSLFLSYFNISFSQSGNLDLTFGTTGIVSTDMGVPFNYGNSNTQGYTIFTGAAIQTDGKFIACGYTWNGIAFDFAVVRYKTDGNLDTSFSNDGKLMTNFGSSDNKARTIAIQSDGKIIVAGSAGNSFALARYNTNGSPDISFNNNGQKVSDFGGMDSVMSIVIQPDGRILAGGSVLARYNTDGTPDESFGTNGKLSDPFPYGYPFNCLDLVLQSDKKIIVSGRYENYCIVARYNANGTIDSDFANQGMYLLAAGPYNTKVGASVTMQEDGKLLIGGYDEYKRNQNFSSRFNLFRLNPNGTEDAGFSFSFSGINNFDYGYSVALQSNNKIIVAGYSNDGTSDHFAMLRYNADGSKDLTFKGNGLPVTNASPSNDRISKIAIKDNKLYAAGYGEYPGHLGVVARYLLDADGGPLPVTLINFSAAPQNQAIALSWEVSGQLNFSKYIIQHSLDGSNFTQKDSVTATARKDYATIDHTPATGLNFYRLKMIDKDGKFTYSKIVTATIIQGYSFSISPNPATNILSVQLSGLAEKSTLQIMDATGRKLQEINIGSGGGKTIPLNIINLRKGLYILQLTTNKKTESRKFIKE